MPWSRRARLSSCHLLFGLIPPEGSFCDDAEAGDIIYNHTLSISTPLEGRRSSP